jgi:hypothetical protein
MARVTVKWQPQIVALQLMADTERQARKEEDRVPQECAMPIFRTLSFDKFCMPFVHIA